MARRFHEHVGRDQLVNGMPKHMRITADITKPAGENPIKTYWRFTAKPGACEVCQAMSGVWFSEKPERPHPNCKCKLESFQAMEIKGSTDKIIIPPDVDIAANLAEARWLKRELDEWAGAAENLWTPSIAQGIAYIFKCAWIFLHFKSGADYDFKKGGHPEYANFGNYHYGLYTKAMGINVTFAQAAAGAAQIWDRTSDWHWLGTYFDDPEDQEMIRRGQAIIER